MPSNIDVLTYLIKTIASWKNSWTILISLLVLIILMLYFYHKRPIKDFLVKDNEVILYLEKGKTKNLSFNQFDRIKANKFRAPSESLSRQRDDSDDKNNSSRQ